jgi:hypothetical protein
MNFVEAPQVFAEYAIQQGGPALSTNVFESTFTIVPGDVVYQRLGAGAILGLNGGMELLIALEAVALITVEVTVTTINVADNTPTVIALGTFTVAAGPHTFAARVSVDGSGNVRVLYTAVDGSLTLSTAPIAAIDPTKMPSAFLLVIKLSTADVSYLFASLRNQGNGLTIA